MDDVSNDVNVASLVESCKPTKKRGRPSHKRQILEIREEKKINLQTSDSVVAATNLRSILTLETLKTLPDHSQSQLIRLLPKLDQITNKTDGKLEPRETALSNEYFARFCMQYIEKLSDNKLSDDAIEQAKSDTTKELAKLDPWKLRNYEPIWGEKLISQTIDDEEDDILSDKLLHRIRKKRSKEKNINSTQKLC